MSWSRIATRLPLPDEMEVRGAKATWTADASLAVDFQLEGGGEKVIRFFLAWYAPDFIGSTKDTTRLDSLLGQPGPVRHAYRSMYAARYSSSLDAARRMAEEHHTLLRRVIKWQEHIYRAIEFPVWVRDQLVNTLCLIPEDSYWVQARPPIGDFAFPAGLFGLNESSRGCPHMECICCSWYGNMPVVYFFPDLALSTLRAFKEYQRRDGSVPFELGSGWNLPDFATPSYQWQVALNGTFYVDLVDRVWRATGDDSILHEFYESVKRCNTFTMNLNTGPGGVISMPTDGPKTEVFEFGEWDGMCAHMGGMRLAQLQIVERMAGKMGDQEYADRCRRWFTDGSVAMETEMWDERGFYLNFMNKESGRTSDDVMAYQLVADWMSRYHGFGGAFDDARAKQVLATIKRINIGLTPRVGAANFARPDGTPLAPDSGVAFYGPFSMFPPEVMMLAMVYVLHGERDFGLTLFEKLMENMVLVHGHAWDLPNIISGETGERNFGTDYYQNMMFWALPATLLATDIAGLCRKGGVVEGIRRAAAGGERG